MAPRLLAALLLAGGLRSVPAAAQKRAGSPPPAASQTAALAGSALVELRRALGPGLAVTPASAASAKAAPLAFRRVDSAVTVSPTGLAVPRPGQPPLVFRHQGQSGDTTAGTQFHYQGFDAPSGLVWVSREDNIYTEEQVRRVPNDGEEPMKSMLLPFRTTHLLVSPASGQVVEIAGPPQPNVPRTMLLAAYRRVGADGLPQPGFQLWRVGRGQVRLLRDVPLTYWYVARSRWLTPNRLWLEMGSMWDLVHGARPRVQAIELTIN
jgi:hypothetical protein